MATPVTVTTVCPECKKTTDLEVTHEGLVARQRGALIQDCFPELPPEKREMLQTGICPGCWEEMFGPEVDDGYYIDHEAFEVPEPEPTDE
jgi:hypothetical protein